MNLGFYSVAPDCAGGLGVIRQCVGFTPGQPMEGWVFQNDESRQLPRRLILEYVAGSRCESVLKRSGTPKGVAF